MEPKRRKVEGASREEQTRATIIAAAQRLVQKHGLHKVTMEDIASALGKKKSFLYYYYPGRREVIQAVIQAEFTEMQQHVREAVAAQKGAVPQLRTFVMTRMESVLKRAADYGATTISTLLQGVEPGTDFASVLELRKVFDREEEHFFADILRRGIEEGAFKPLPNKAIDDISYFVLSALRGVELELALSQELRPAPSPRLTKVLEVFLRGLAT